MKNLTEIDNSLVAAALNYRDRGWSVVPVFEPMADGHCSCGNPGCSHPGKHARTSWAQYQKRLPTETEIREWWSRWPNANIGLVCGAVSGVVVIDIDGGEAIEAAKKYGGLSPAPTVQTSRGVHLYYQHPGPGVSIRSGELFPRLEVHADKTLALLPPSRHADGVDYHWLHSPEERDLPPLPDWILGWDGQGNGRRQTPASKVDGFILEGQRNVTLTSLAGSMRRRGMTEEAIFAALQAENKRRCQPPLDEEEVRRIAESVARYPPAVGNGAESRVSSKDVIHNTDLGNARRLVARHGQDIRFCYPWRRWLVWDDRHWQFDDSGEVERRAKETVAAIYAEAAGEPEETRRKALGKWALQSESHVRLHNMLVLAQSEPTIPVLPDELDTQPWLLNCQNGTLDLRTGELRPHRREDLITKCIPVEYHPDAECPHWLAFLGKIMAEKQGLIDFLQRAVGYSLTGVTDERVMFILHGAGRNGKTTFLEAVAELLGVYALRTPTETLLIKRGDAIPNDIARLKGARFVYASESEQGRRLAESLVKDVTGGDTISARFMRAEWFDFVPEFKLWLGTNHKPVIRGTDDAVWDRIRLIPFTVRIPDEEIIPKSILMARFREEFPGILAWAVRGCLKWQKHKLGTPEEVREATAGYREEMDVLAGFLADCCVEGPDKWVAAGALYKAYREWCEKTGESPISQTAFGIRLAERGFVKDIGRVDDGSVRRLWRGVGLVTRSGSVTGCNAFSGLSTRKLVESI